MFMFTSIGSCFLRSMNITLEAFLAGKTEALSDDLQGAERRIEFIRNICQNSKKINTGTENTPREKRMKKNPDYCLGATMIESASNEENRLLKEVVTHCGTLLMCLATAHVDHEIKVETKIVEPMLKISENDYPNIIKQKKNLTKLILDMDSARTRYQTAAKNINTAGSKVDSIKDELEEAELKVDQCRDLLACDMLQMMAQESEVSQTVLEFAQLLRNYHTAALAVLDNIIPEIELAINESPCRPVFGKPLEEHLKVHSRKIAFPVELCVTALLELGIAEEGLFRVTAGASKVKRMKLNIDANWPNLDLNSALQVKDPHVYTVVLKSYLRELPEPLLTHNLYDQWMAAAKLVSTGQIDAGLTALWTALRALPEANMNNLHYLIKFFSSLASNKETNKMTTQNLAIVIAPNLLWAPSEDMSTMGLNMNTANLQSVIVDTLLSYVNWFFPEEIEFYQTLSKPDISPRMLNGHIVSEDVEASPQHQHSQLALHQGTVQHAQHQAHAQQPEVIIKRTLSNSSLSDQHSPPMGSPKPAMRSRRQKPAAPNPPVNRASFSGGKLTGTTNLSPYQQQPPKEEKEQQAEQSLKPVEQPRPASTGSTGSLSGGLDRSPGNPFSENDDQDPPGNPFDSGEEDGGETKVSQDVKTTPTAKSRQSLQPAEDPPPEPSPKPNTVSEIQETTQQANTPIRAEMTFTAYEKMEEERPSLNRGMSKSGEGLDTYRHQVERTASSAEQRRPDRPERPYSTLDRKKPSGTNRPVPAPRVTLDASKPCVPERPANLPRPHSSSFRINRNTSDSSPDQCDNPVNLERAHMYSVDKQQVSFVHFDKPGGEKSENTDKPEKPKKPSYLPQSGHQRAMSEGSIIDTGLDRLKLQMSAPPPPPTSSSSNINDSTNL